MKIKSVKPLKNGMSESAADSLFDKIAAFAGYGFNRSHAIEYSIVSYWTMWLRVRYPAEYFAACLSIVGDDKLEGLVKDAREYGIEVLPPDVNRSTHRFTIPDDKHLLAPFSSVKGISENTAKRIVELRERNRGWKVVKQKKKRDGTIEAVYGLDEDSPCKGRFDTAEEFMLAASQPGSKVNAKVVENLRLVGALADIEAGSKPARHLDRRKDQLDLMPGLIIDSVKADRSTDVKDPFLRTKIIHLIQDYRKCEGCDLAGQPHPAVRMKANIKFMVVSDCPSWQEEKADKLLEGDAADFIKAAITDVGLSPADGYYTTLVKAKKNDKFLSNGQINGCKAFLDHEIALIKPPIIVALGSAAIKRFVPGVKGGTAELAGRVIYDPALDASIVCGINAQQIIFDSSKAEVLKAIFEKVADMLA